jgi:hypothetical protein
MLDPDGLDIGLATCVNSLDVLSGESFLRFDLAVPLQVMLHLGPSYTFSGVGCASLSI